VKSDLLHLNASFKCTGFQTNKVHGLKNLLNPCTINSINSIQTNKKKHKTNGVLIHNNTE